LHIHILLVNVLIINCPSQPGSRYVQSSVRVSLVGVPKRSGLEGSERFVAEHNHAGGIPVCHRKWQRPKAERRVGVAPLTRRGRASPRMHELPDPSKNTRRRCRQDKTASGGGDFGVAINHARSRIRFAPGTGQRTESGRRGGLARLTRRRQAGRVSCMQRTPPHGSGGRVRSEAGIAERQRSEQPGASKKLPVHRRTPPGVGGSQLHTVIWYAGYCTNYPVDMHKRYPVPCCAWSTPDSKPQPSLT